MSKILRVLVVDDDHGMTKTIVDILKATGYEAKEAHSGAKALNMIKKEHFDCVITDVKMPQMNGVELHKAIKLVQPELPVVFMTAFSTDALVNKGLKHGAIATMVKPLDIHLMLTFFTALRKEQSIVIVDDDPVFCKTMGDILQVRGFAVTKVIDPHRWDKNIMQDEQIMLLDMKLNGTDGLDILKQVKAKYPHLAVIMITGYGDEMAMSIKKAISISAYTCLYKPIEIKKLLKTLSELRNNNLGRILGRPVNKGRK